MNKLYNNTGTIIRGKMIASTGVSSQFDERALIQQAKSKGQTVVRNKKQGTLHFMQPK